MLSLLAPLGLLALTALAIPLLIHLIRRQDSPLHDFAALRWLAPKTPRPRLRWREPLLLALRLLLLALLAILLTAPVWRGGFDRGPGWAVALPGISAEAARAAIGDETLTLRSLAPGFPSLEDAPPSEGGNTASLIRELAVTVPAHRRLVLLVPRTLAGMDAERLQLGRELEWRVLPGSSPATADPAMAEALSPGLDPRRAAGPDEPLTPWLIWASLAVFALERLLSLPRARSGATP